MQNRANGAIRLLILDGHDLHVTWEFLDYCLQNDIIPLCLPAHSTHILQPLDVGLFGPLQQNYSHCLDDYTEGGETGINKGDFYPSVNHELKNLNFFNTFYLC